LPEIDTSDVADHFMRELTVQDQSLSRLLAAVHADRLTRRRLLAAGAALAGTTLAPAALVGAQQATPAASPGATPVGKPGGTIKIAFEANPDDLNPFTMSSLVSALVVEQVYDTLFIFDENLASQPNLCTSYETPDDKTYLFHLAQNATFSDGTPLTSADVKFSLESYKDPNIGARAWAQPIDSVETVDDVTVKVNLSQPYAPLIGYLSWQYTPIVSKAFYEANNGDISQKVMGSGPFLLQEFVPDQVIKFAKNPNYWQDGLPYLDAMEWTILPDDQARVAALRGNDVQNADFLDHQAVESFENDPNWKIYEVSTLTHATTYINCSSGPLADARVRQALSYAIDRNEFLQGAALGYGQVTGYIPASDKTWSIPVSDLPTYQTNIDKAKELLAEAGYADGFDVKLRVSSLYILDTANAQILQQQLKPIGVNVEIEQLEWGNLLDAWVNSDFEMLNILLLGLPDPDGYCWGRYHSTSPTNYNKISDSELDGLMDKARAETDLEARKSLYADIQKKLDTLVPNLFYYVYNVWLIWDPSVQGITPLPNSSAPYMKRIWIEQ
jgi:peptide/nickel transport system substrate-binding protein